MNKRNSCLNIQQKHKYLNVSPTDEARITNIKSDDRKTFWRSKECKHKQTRGTVCILLINKYSTYKCLLWQRNN